MTIPSLAQFKIIRKRSGSIYAIYSMLEKSGMCEHQADHVVDAIVTELSIRGIERLKAKKLYDFVDGFILGCQEFLVNQR
jgi:hypothetical protein